MTKPNKPVVHYGAEMGGSGKTLTELEMRKYGVTTLLISSTAQLRAVYGGDDDTPTRRAAPAPTVPYYRRFAKRNY